MHKHNKIAWHGHFWVTSVMAYLTKMLNLGVLKLIGWLVDWLPMHLMLTEEAQGPQEAILECVALFLW